MGDPVVRLTNVVALFKAETVEGVDSVPAANVDAFPFEIDSMEIGAPYAMEQSNESTGTEIAGAPTINSQLVNFRIRMRLKGAGSGIAYTALIKPPCHAFLQSCGLKGQFQAAVAGALSTAGSATSSTLNASYAATAQLYRGMRALIGAGAGNGQHPLIADYTAGKVATLTDSFTPVLDATTSVSINANWTYAATSPATAAERITDQPSGTLYCHTDTQLTKLFGLRGTPKIMADTAKTGFFEVSGTAIWGGQSNIAQPTNALIATHIAPTFQMNALISNAFSVNRKALPISSFSFDWARGLEGLEDPNTPAGFGAGQIMGREPMLECDPLKHQDLSVRSHLADLEAAIGGAAPMVGAVRVGSVSGNRWSLTMPFLRPVKVDWSSRKGLRSETIGFRAFSSGRDNAGRDGDAILCFD
jgi:hypothetical protein